MKLFRFQATVERAGHSPFEFTDWYTANTEAEARKLFVADCQRYGIINHKHTAIIIECNPETLKPV